MVLRVILTAVKFPRQRSACDGFAARESKNPGAESSSTFYLPSMQIINMETRKYRQEAERVEDQEDVHPVMLWLSGLWFA